MFGIINLQATRQILQDLARVVKFTRQTLAAMLNEDEQAGRLPTRQPAGRLSDALEHLGEVREGFILSQRTSPHTAFSDLQALIQHVLISWDWLHDLDLSLAPGDHIETVGPQLVVYNHALVALAVLPRLPAEAVTFPQHRPTYGDVTVPVLPDEMLARIEEIERMIYQANVKSVHSLDYAPFRRTYAFFEASNWLVNNHLAPLIEE